MDKLCLLCLSLFIFISGCQWGGSSEQVQQREGFSGASNQKAAEINTRLGLAYLGSGDTVRAKHKLLLALQQDAQSALVHSAMGYFLEKTGSLAEADKQYQKSLSLSPRKGEVLNNYGTYLCRMKQYAEAEKFFLAAVKDPHYVYVGEAYENAGLCAMQVPHREKARLYFEAALSQDPQRIYAREELSQLKKVK